MGSYSLLAVIAIGLASNLDNAGVGIAYGVRKIRIPWYSNLAIAIISFLATLVSGFFGSWLSSWIHPWIGQLLGTVVIVGVGVWVLLQPFLEKKITSVQEEDVNPLTRLLRNPEEADKDSSKSINLGESVVLGIALAMNALAGGFNAGITHLNVWYTSLSVGLFSYLLLAACAGFGEKFAAEKFGNRATVISGLLLILIGIHQLF
ncbi:MAG: sporulation membrane protein YtaF [Paenibacillaceae bacterium]|uniref:Sporulation membrane protein YtaF n=1 Tax=Paenibacillus mellifer TaxID=2937794 RepID=A0A9X1XXV6_9BACL|nr:sporulation membrane protein YtaF [Paenibacillus mellifer]MBW4838108.1 sporulation membrane protein YtaF [Paenibacillaceae bacterium]MCK8485738.1 sporulation membrane protein YtaF [Paenibacillus mellifer]